MGILQARILEWVAIPFSRGSSQPRDKTHMSCIARSFFTVWEGSWLVFKGHPNPLGLQKSSSNEFMLWWTLTLAVNILMCLSHSDRSIHTRSLCYQLFNHFPSNYFPFWLSRQTIGHSPWISIHAHFWPFHLSNKMANQMYYLTFYSLGRISLHCPS